MDSNFLKFIINYKSTNTAAATSILSQNAEPKHIYSRHERHIVAREKAGLHLWVRLELIRYQFFKQAWD